MRRVEREHGLHPLLRLCGVFPGRLYPRQRRAHVQLGQQRNVRRRRCRPDRELFLACGFRHHPIDSRGKDPSATAIVGDLATSSPAAGLARSAVASNVGLVRSPGHVLDQVPSAVRYRRAPWQQGTTIRAKSDLHAASVRGCDAPQRGARRSSDGRLLGSRHERSTRGRG